MILPKFNLTADDRRLLIHLETFPRELQSAISRHLKGLVGTLLTQVVAAEPERTGYLRSQTRAYVDERKDWVRGRVRIQPTGRAQQVAAYFGALEYGVHSTFPVRAHRTRMTHVFGRAIPLSGVLVRAHQRTVHIAARRFLRGPGGVMLARARSDIQAAIDEAITRTQRS
jgi:hypothetical protein